MLVLRLGRTLAIRECTMYWLTVSSEHFVLYSNVSNSLSGATRILAETGKLQGLESEISAEPGSLGSRWLAAYVYTHYLHYVIYDILIDGTPYVVHSDEGEPLLRWLPLGAI
jgi:hypothetical protein